MPEDRTLTLFLINIFKNKINWCSIMDTVCLYAPTKEINNLSILIYVMFQNLVIHQGASQLQTASENPQGYFFSFSASFNLRFLLTY
jgi:hypothetical protein